MDTSLGTPWQQRLDSLFFSSTRCWKYFSHFGACWHDSIAQLIYWTEIWCLWRSSECSDLIVMLKNPVWVGLSFVTRCAILLGTLWSYMDGHDEQQVVTKCAKKIVPAHHTSSSSVNCWYKAGWSPAFTLSPDFDPKVQFWWDFAKCSLGFLFPADTSANQCGLLLPLLFCVPWLERVNT